MPLPTGTITFLFSDIEGSSRLWERHPEPMRLALARHDAILRKAAAANQGFVFKTIGDAFCIAFDSPLDAVLAATEAQTALHFEPWAETGPLRVRIAIHIGTAELRDNDYFGNTLNRVARLLSAAHGGQTLVSFPVEELVRDQLPLHLRLIDLGERRLRDLNRPEHIFQIAPDGLPAEFPPLRSLEALPNNLPSNFSTFVGREREVAKVRELLTSTRLLTLTGTGGTGKTRLSIQAAAEVLEQFPDGTWFIEFATISDPDRVVETVAATLDVREDANSSLRASVIRYLTHRRVLLVMDNCEHLLAACAQFAAELLKTCPHLRILATSRHSLGISGERTWPVPPLSTINPYRDLFQISDVVAKVSQYEAVRLFIDRASAAKPDFEVTEKNAPAIAQICWRLDGIPLAIELAAARAKVLSPEQISQRLDDRFRLLTGGNRSVLPHQQTLRTLIDWSYDLLSESERVLFRRLGAFAGGRTLEAIEAVCTGDGVDTYDALDLLQHLVDKSLLALETGPDGSSRYTMIESVWQYARDRLNASPEAPAMRDRHLEFFTALAVEARPALEGPDLAHWLDHVDAERINFRSAIAHAANSPTSIQQGLTIVGALARYWEVRGNLEEARDSFDLLLNAPGAESPTPARAEALSGAGRIAWCQDRTADAERFYTLALENFELLGNRDMVGLIKAFTGFVARNANDLETAEQKFREAIATGHEIDNIHVTAIGLSGLGSIAGDRGDFRTGRRFKEESLAIFRARGDKWISGYNLWGIARICLVEGDATSARNALIEWSDIARELRNRWVLPFILQVFAGTLLLESQPELAARILGAAEAAREALNITLDESDQRELDNFTTSLRAALDAPAIDREWQIGRQLSIWEAIEVAKNVPVPA